MRKLMIVLAMAGISSVAMAQETSVPQKKHSVATNSFWSNWFISAGADYTANYSNQEYGMGLATSPFEKFRGSIGGDFSVGKWFTPGMGFRLRAQALQTKQVNGEEKNNRDLGTINAQAMFNLSNLIGGYKAKRVYNVIPYVGAGVSRNFSDNNYNFVASAGILNTFRISKHWDFNIDIYGMMSGADFDGATARTSNPEGSFSLKNYDRLVGASAGFTYKIGKSTWEKTPDVNALLALHQSEVNGLNGQVNSLRGQLNGKDNQLNAAKKTIDELNKKLEDCQNKKVATSGIETIVSFRQGKSAVDNTQMANVERVAMYLKNNPNSKVVINGYASPEGPLSFNNKLAENRANAVKNILVKKYKVDASRITAEGKGVGSIFESGAMNRVSICTVD